MHEFSPFCLKELVHLIRIICLSDLLGQIPFAHLGLSHSHMSHLRRIRPRATTQEQYEI